MIQEMHILFFQSSWGASGAAICVECPKITHSCKNHATLSHFLNFCSLFSLQILIAYVFMVFRMKPQQANTESQRCRAAEVGRYITHYLSCSHTPQYLIEATHQATLAHKYFEGFSNSVGEQTINWWLKLSLEPVFKDGEWQSEYKLPVVKCECLYAWYQM